MLMVGSIQKGLSPLHNLNLKQTALRLTFPSKKGQTLLYKLYYICWWWEAYRRGYLLYTTWISNRPLCVWLFLGIQKLHSTDALTCVQRQILLCFGAWRDSFRVLTTAIMAESGKKVSPFLFGKQKSFFASIFKRNWKPGIIYPGKIRDKGGHCKNLAGINPIW